MLKHHIDILTNTYIIEEDGVVKFSIELKNGSVYVRGVNDTYFGKVEDLLLKHKSVQTEQ